MDRHSNVTLPPRGAALAVENTDHGIDYVKGIEQWMHAHPGYFTLVFNEKFDLGSPDFSGLLQKVKAAHADIFLADAHLQDYITMHRQYTQTGMRHQMISYGARGPESDARKALGDATTSSSPASGGPPSCPIRR